MDNQRVKDAIAIRITSEYEEQKRLGTGFDPNRLAIAALAAYESAKEQVSLEGCGAVVYATGYLNAFPQNVAQEIAKAVVDEVIKQGAKVSYE